MLVTQKNGVLLVNLGTPDAATPSAIKRYLKQFLHDRRIVDSTPWLWYPLLHGVILPLRVARIAKLYQAVWLEEGSPLLVHSRKQQQALAAQLAADTPVELAMTYGSPSINTALSRLMEQGVNRLVVLPLYPQFSSTTTSAVWDALARFFTLRRDLPEIIFIHDYAEHPLYISALCESIEQSFTTHGIPDLLIFSYHGIPQRYVDEGDNYPRRCEATTQAVMAKLALRPEQHKLTYQSRFGKQPWLRPFTDQTIKALPKQGIKRVQIITPGFAADCLETLEEIAVENQRYFIEAGGEQYHYIPALNNAPAHIELLKSLVTERGC